MPSTYIVGYDGSEASRAAVRFAVSLGEREGADVQAVHVYPRVPASLASGASAITDAELETDVREAAKALLDGLDVDGVARRLVRGDSPAHGLQALAEEEDASLICVGVTRRGPLGRLIPGSVALHLLHGAPCGVAAIPADTPAGRLDPIGVAYDGRPESKDALDVAAQLARDSRSRLIIMSAVEVPTFGAPALGYDPELGPVLRRNCEDMLRDAAAAIPDVDVETRVVPSPVGRSIVWATLEFGMLVTGSRSYGPLRSVLLGSVSRYLVDHAHCPVIVVPRSAVATLDAVAEGTLAVRA